MKLKKRTDQAVAPAKADVSRLLQRWLAAEPAATPLTQISMSEPGVIEAFTDLVDAVSTADHRVPAALDRFGRRLGQFGMLLEEVAASVDRLAAMTPESRALQSFSAGISLASGWSLGHLYGVHEADCVDGLTGLSTLAVLRLRIEQVADQSAWMGVPLEQSYCVLVIDTDIAATDPFEAEIAMMAISEQLRSHYCAGETVARHGARILVLASNSERTRSQLLDVLADLRSLSLPATSRIFGWIEEMTADMRSADTIVDFLTELTIG